MHDVLQYTVTFENGETKQYPEGTTFLEIAKDRQKEYKNDVVLVIQDGKLKELYKRSGKIAGSGLSRPERTSGIRPTKEV